MAEDSRKLFVAGLPDSITEDVLRGLFEATGGSVAEVSLPKDRATGRPRGFGFVTMSTTEEANQARESLHGSFQGGRSISVRPFESDPPKREAGAPGGPMGGPGGGPGGGRFGGPAADPPDRKLYIGNLPYDATPEEVEAVITATGAGPVVRVLLPSDPDGRKRGFGFITMASAEAAKGAVDLLRGAEVRGRRLVVNPAHQRGERPERPDRPPQSGGFGPPSGGFGPPAGGFGPRPPIGVGGPPPPQRKTFDDRRRKGFGDGEGGGGGGGRGGRGGRGKTDDDWDKTKTPDDWDND
jgi:RNA recognition motif-containing protein